VTQHRVLGRNARDAAARDHANRLLQRRRFQAIFRHWSD
jgi:hypothetical protein